MRLSNEDEFMLHRQTDRGTVLLSQPAHARVSAQLARAWGEAIDRREEMILAALQHDVGWTAWEQQPSFNLRTGLPHAFLELDTRAHLEIWSGVARLVEPTSTLAALLVSRHGTRLYQRFHGGGDPASVEPQVREYLTGEKAAQQRLLATVLATAKDGALIDDAWLDRASALIAAWDWLSLVVCMTALDRGTIHDVPWDGRRIDIEAMREDEARWRMAPWVFAPRELTLITEGRLMPHPARDEAEMRSMLDAAEVVRLEVELAPG